MGCGEIEVRSDHYIACLDEPTGVPGPPHSGAIALGSNLFGNLRARTVGAAQGKDQPWRNVHTLKIDWDGWSLQADDGVT